MIYDDRPSEGCTGPLHRDATALARQITADFRESGGTQPKAQDMQGHQPQ
jgi:hypothetical protein